VLIILVAPFGRFMAIRTDLLEATKLETEGGTGIGQNFGSGLRSKSRLISEKRS
jgi:hypothetical protein